MRDTRAASFAIIAFIAQFCPRAALGQAVQVNAQWAVDSPEQYAAALDQPAMASSLRSNIRSVYEMAGLSPDLDAGVALAAGISGGSPGTTTAAAGATTAAPGTTTAAPGSPKTTTKAAAPPPPGEDPGKDSSADNSTGLLVVGGVVAGVALFGAGFFLCWWRGGPQGVLYQKVPSAEFDRGVIPVKIDRDRDPPGSASAPPQAIPVFVPQQQTPRTVPVLLPPQQQYAQPIQPPVVPQQYAQPIQPPVVPQQYTQPLQPPQYTQPVPVFAVPADPLHSAARGTALFELPPHLRVRLSQALREV